MSKRGRFFVIEGLEGAGKTTAIETIALYLQSRVQNVILVREPGTTPLGESLRRLIKETATDSMTDCSELLLMYAARVQLLEQVIYPALTRGDWVLSDRFELSSYAYQGGGRGIPKADIDALSQLCLHGFKPDWTFFLDIPPAMGLARVKERGTLDRIEVQPLAFFKRIRDEYCILIEGMQTVSIIDAVQPLPVVQQMIVTALKQVMSQYEPV